MKNRFIGCLVGGAIGDALGYQVEFMSLESIRERYGERGVQGFPKGVLGEISDDTQMTLFLGEALAAGGSCEMGLDGLRARIYLGFLDWYGMQRGRDISRGICSRLAAYPSLGCDRAPGLTCLSALGSGVCGSIERPINGSKGCGGIMRVAPVSLYCAGKRYSADFAAVLGAESAAITHGNELGYTPTAYLVYLLRYLLVEQPESLREAVDYAGARVVRAFPTAHFMKELLSGVERAVRLAEGELDDTEAIAQLGEGWVAEEALFIALFSALRYERNFHRAIACAANHSGDSDSTAAITGNILGAHLGIDRIPRELVSAVELTDLCRDIAERLYLTTL